MTTYAAVATPPSNDHKPAEQHVMPMTAQSPSPHGISVEKLSLFLQTFLPIKALDVPFLYHVPRHPSFDRTTTNVHKAIFSITPTRGVYDALHKRSYNRQGPPGVNVAFIHRPFALDRYRVPRRHGVVLSSHKSMDELLTTGWNVQLARALKLDVDRCVCIQGYKGDPERRIGLVSAVNSTEWMMCQAILAEFKGWEDCFGFSAPLPLETDVFEGFDSSALQGQIKAVAIMNAFHPEEIDRVLDAAVQAGFIQGPDEYGNLLYLTGAVRQLGLDAALERGIRVVCVGHKTCEDWGVRFLAEQVRKQYPELDVIEIDEPEEPRQFEKRDSKPVDKPVKNA